MRLTALTMASLVLAACGNMPGMPGQGAGSAVPAERQATFVALVEANDCRVDPVGHQYVHDAGFTDAELDAMSEALIADGSAVIGADGALILTSGACI